MRCIEILLIQVHDEVIGEININMRCIEIHISSTALYRGEGLTLT